MPRSIHALMRAGVISERAVAKHKPSVLKGTKAQPSKMAHMDEDNASDEGSHPRGEYKANEINERRHQRGTKPSHAAGAHGNAAPGANHINQKSLVAKKFPPGGKAPGKSGIVKTPPATKGTVIESGPMYEGKISRRTM
jgi:hypothetical protein